MGREWGQILDSPQQTGAGNLSAVVDRLSAHAPAQDSTLQVLKPVKKPQVESTIASNVVWEPIPDSSQSFAIVTRAHHTLMHGARGPGKTITQLMRFRSRVGLGYGAYWKGIIFDREFKNLSDMVAQSNRFFPKFEDGAKFHASATAYKWVWPTGEELLFRHVKKLDDYDAFHGHEYPFIGWNELTKQPTAELYDKFMSVNRCSFVSEKHTPTILQNGQPVYDTPDQKPLPPISLEVFATTNPNGPGHNWVKRRFIDVAKNGEIVKNRVTYFDTSAGQEVEVIRTQVAIFGSFFENPYLDPVYRAGLIESCANNPNLHAAWIEGRWDVNSGGAINDVWDTRVHVIDRFQIPVEWKVDRSFDWGSTHPFATVFWAEANGEEVRLPNGKTWCPPRGSLIAIEEDYGTENVNTNKGLKLSAKDVALRIKSKEEVLFSEQWIKSRVQAGPADNQIRNVTESDVDTIEYKMEKEGVRWIQSDKSAGSRIIGLQLMRDRLQASTLLEGPGIYFMRNCKHCVELLPPLPRDPDKPDDVDTDAEDHLWDAVRYRVLKGSNKFITKIKMNWAH
jgi:hypothetical protein